MVQHFSLRIEDSCDLPDSESSAIDPLISYDDVVEAFKTSFEAKGISVDEMNSWTNAYDKLVEPMTTFKRD
jgi:hypothetical protein